VIYFDTSYLVRLYFRDLGWEAVRELAATDHLVCAIHGRAEMIAALLDQAAADDAEEAIRWVPLSPPTLTKVAAVYSALPASTFLRAADALHLATAAEQGLTTIFSNDHHLLAAATHFGLSGRNVIPTGL
jgi:predicted nucleic acid-binding protein